jgi:hypothetical protein
MSHSLTLELSDEVYATVQQQAENAGLSLTEWILACVEQQSIAKNRLGIQTHTEKEAARQRFRRHAGSIDLGYPTGADNDSIDADLARAYSNNDKVEN